MPNDITDVNTTDTSSTSDTPASANADQVANNDTASTAVEQSNQPKDLDSAIEAGFKAATAEKPVDDEEKEEEGVEQVEQQTEDVAKVETQGPIPYERFAQVNEAKNVAEQQIAEYKTHADAYKGIEQYCQSNGITHEDYNYWMGVAAAFKNNPEEALKFLQPKYAELQSYKGEVLSPELTKAVENGELSLDYAKKLAIAENRQKHIEKQTIQQQKQAQALNDSNKKLILVSLTGISRK